MVSQSDRICLLCNEEIDLNDDCRSTMLYTAESKPIERLIHRECSLRSVIGGIGHLTDHAHWCKIMNDPDGGRTYRQSALEVDQWVHENGVEAAVAKGSDAFH